MTSGWCCGPLGEHDAPFHCYPCARGDHDGHKTNAWEPGIPCECPPCAIPYRAAFYRVLERCEELKTQVGEHQWNALEMARKADQAERRAEESEYYVEQLRDARDSAERRVERACEVLDGWERDGPDGYEFHLLILRVREALDGGVE